MSGSIGANRTVVLRIQLQKLKTDQKRIFQQSILVFESDHFLCSVDYDQLIPSRHAEDVFMQSPISHLKSNCILVNRIEVQGVDGGCDQPW